jgi:hypothetical protein
MDIKTNDVKPYSFYICEHLVISSEYINVITSPDKKIDEANK